MSEYVREINTVFSTKILKDGTQEKKKIATLDGDGNAVYEPGMIGPHKKRLEEWLQKPPGQEEPGTSEKESPEEPQESTEGLQSPGNTHVFVGDAPAPVSGQKQARKEPETKAEWEVSTIPENQLPPFSREHGMDTPGLREYVKKHNLAPVQVEALVRRLERM